MKAMLFAAGLGTRLKPITDHCPKALVKVGQRSLLELNIRRLIQVGVTDLVVNIHHKGDQIVAFLKEHNNFGINIQISDETSLLLDTGGGLLNAQSFLDGEEPFIVYNVDILSSVNLSRAIQMHNEQKAMATVVVRDRKTSRYLLFDSQDHLVGWNREEQFKWVNGECFDYRRLAFSGIHIVSPKLFRKLAFKGPQSIIDIYLQLAKENLILGYEDSSTYWLDTGDHERLKKAEELISEIKEYQD